jgi:uncharacterized protein (TIGR03067 family)
MLALGRTRISDDCWPDPCCVFLNVGKQSRGFAELPKICIARCHQELTSGGRIVTLFFRLSSVLTIAVVLGSLPAIAPAQTGGAEHEVERLQGHWRIVEMTENGRNITETEMRHALPGGGLLEVIDNTLLFKSPVDGHKSTKSIRIDAASYPKKIAIVDREMVTGVGIYEFDRGRWVICVASPESSLPTELSAPSGSNRMLMVLEKYEPGKTDFQLDLSPRSETPRIPVANASLQKQSDLAKLTPRPQPTPQPPIIIQQVQPPVVIQQSAAGRILTDDEVRTMMVGNWQMKDGEGLVDITFYSNGTFRAYRRSQVVSTFHTTFVPTPVSTGNYSIQNGVLNMRVTSSWRAEKVNLAVTMAVRSISASDAILVDNLGRVSRAVKVQ